MNVTITFAENDAVLVKLTNPTISNKEHFFQDTLNQFILTPRDSFIIYTNINPTIDRFYAIDYSLEKNNIGIPIYKPYNNNGFDYIEKGLYRSTILIENGEIFLPLLTQHITLPNPESWPANNWKLFNDNIFNLLQASDTVVIQTKTVKLIRQ